MVAQPAKFAAVVVAASLVVLVGCGSERTVVDQATEPGAEPGKEPATEPGTTRTTTGQTETRLTDLARQAVEDLRASPGDYESSTLTSDPETWLVEIDLDVPIDEADFDDPLAALPPPLDAMAPGAVQIVVRANTPNDSREVPFSQTRLEPPFTGLVAKLDGSSRVATTVPGDDPPSTSPSTWPIDNVRIASIVLPVVDFDALPEAAEILAAIPADDVWLGPADGFDVVSLADAEAGVPATHPPLTGTRLPTTQADG